jgi:hypothetical protein
MKIADVLRTCACGAQTTFAERCIPCERQKSANEMMDRIAELNAELLPPSEPYKIQERWGNVGADGRELALCLATLYQDWLHLLLWQRMTANLKFFDLSIPHVAGFADATAIMDDLIATIPKTIEMLKRGRLPAIPGTPPSES